MSVEVSYKHMETSPYLNEYVQEKLTKTIAKFSTKPAIIARILFAKEQQDHIVTLNLHLDRETDIHLKASAPYMYRAVDQLNEMLDKKLRRAKSTKKSFQRDSIRKIELSEEEDSVEAAASVS